MSDPLDIFTSYQFLRSRNTSPGALVYFLISRTRQINSLTNETVCSKSWRSRTLLGEWMYRQGTETLPRKHTFSGHMDGSRIRAPKERDFLLPGYE